MKKEVKDERLTFRLTQANKEALQTEAEDLGLTLSELIGGRLFEAEDMHQTLADATAEFDEQLAAQAQRLNEWQNYAENLKKQVEDTQRTLADTTADNRKKSSQIKAYDDLLEPLFAQVQSTTLYDEKRNIVQINSKTDLLTYILSTLTIKK